MAAPISMAKADRVIQLAIKLGLNHYHFGSCGSAAVAINRTLFASKGRYCVATDRAAQRNGRPSGHVSVMYRTALFDYEGRCDLNRMGEFVRGNDFEIRSGVRESTIIRHFVKHYTLPIEDAEKILTLAKIVEGTVREAQVIRDFKRALKGDS